MLLRVANPIPPENQVDPTVLGAALAARGVSQTELAKRLNLTLGAVNRWINGKAALSTSRWVHVKKVLGLPDAWEPGQPVPDLPPGWKPPRD